MKHNRAITAGDQDRAGIRRDQPATQKQIDLLKKLKLDPKLFKTRREASDAISAMLGRR